MGTQKNSLNETVLLSTQNILKVMCKKTFIILRSKILFINIEILHGANFTIENDKGADQTARMCRLVCVFDVPINQI